MTSIDTPRQVTKPRTALAVLCCLFGIASSLYADSVAKPDAIVAVETWVRQVTADARPDAVVERLEPYVVGGRTVAYIAHLRDGGCCICGADDRLLPVYLYNPVARYDPANPNYQYILGEIATRYARLDEAAKNNDPVLEQYRDLLTERAAQWTELSAGRVPVSPPDRSGDRADPTIVELPVTSYWRQGSPYSDYCPELTPGADEHAIAGCVATAMAQIMYYWEWPNIGSGTGSTTYYWRYTTSWIAAPLANDPQIPGDWAGGNRLRYDSVNHELEMNGYWDNTLYEGAQHNWIDPNDAPEWAYLSALATLWGDMTHGSTVCTADFGGIAFDWDLMCDDHTDPPDAGDLQAALLSYHAGVAVDMDYGVWASSAFTDFTPFAYRTYFDYDPDAVYTGCSEATLINEAQWFRPAQIRGESESGGHSWVVAGYNTGVSPTQFLMNMGWGGGTNNWYSCDEVFPSDQGQVSRIAPESVVRFVDQGTYGGDGTPDSPYLGFSHALSVAPDDTILIMKAGSTHSLSGDPVVVDKPFTLKGYDVTIAKQ